MKRVLIIAHRGASAVAPESTKAAIRAAAHAGAGMIELDVQMTQDNRLIVFHDDRLERTTDGTGTVRSSRYAQLARLDSGAWFHARFAGERILLLSQTLRLIPPWMWMNLELKQTRQRAALLRRLVRCVRRCRVVSRLLISSFDPSLLQPLSRRLATALICRRHPDRSLQQAIRLGCVAWHPFYTLLTRERLHRAHAAHLRVHAWTVDDLPRARQLIRRGVDGIFTNDPARLAGRLSR